MIKMAVAAVTVASLIAVSGASWAQVGVGGNAVAKYPSVEASKNKKVTNHGVGGNAEPKYAATPAKYVRVKSRHRVPRRQRNAGALAAPSGCRTGVHRGLFVNWLSTAANRLHLVQRHPCILLGLLQFNYVRAFADLVE